jgi:methylenetetrahydrofolate dehydrogenase (NADP+)/methenyltetrahydrofolate cyclohydrolase
MAHSPVSHTIFVDLAFEGDDPRREHRRVERNAPERDFAQARFFGTAFEQAAVAFQHVGTAARNLRRDVVRRNEAIERRFELFGRKRDVQTYFAADAFQDSLLGRTNGDGVPAQILDGRALAADLRTELLARTGALREAGIHPNLTVVVIGENESGLAYVRNLIKTGERAGIAVDVRHLPEDATAGQVRTLLHGLEADPSVHGVLLQQPLPPHLAVREIADAIPLHKDVDGAHPINQGELAFGSGCEFVPATPAAVMLLLERSPHWPLRGRPAVMIGRSIVVGAPVAMLLLAQDATVTILHNHSASLQPFVRMAEVVVVATGVPGLIRGEDLMPGATVIDVGTTVVDGVLKGDVDFESAAEVAGAITPVPGGVGPVTNVALLRNVVKACERSLAG